MADTMKKERRGLDYDCTCQPQKNFEGYAPCLEARDHNCQCAMGCQNEPRYIKGRNKAIK